MLDSGSGNRMREKKNRAMQQNWPLWEKKMYFKQIIQVCCIGQFV